jgi:hypothetical protein
VRDSHTSFLGTFSFYLTSEIKRMAAANTTIDLGGIAGLTVDSIKKSETREIEAAEEAKKAKARAESESKSWGKAQTQFMKLEADRRKEMMKEAERLRGESDEVKKKRLGTMYNRYIESFPFLKDKIPKATAKTSAVEYEELIRLIREEMDSQRSMFQLNKYLDLGFYSAQTFWGDGSKMTFLPPPLRFNLSGIAEFHKRGLFRNELEPLLMEIDIEYPWLGRQSLLLRSLEALSEVMIKTHLINSNPDARKILGLEKEAPKVVPGMDKI